MSELIERVALNLRLAGFCHTHTHSVQTAQAAIRVIAPAVERALRERDQAVEALRFYARENSWKSCGMYMSGRPNPSSAEIDKGNKARATLASIEGADR